MIGVIVNSSERAVSSEFFELFKTPWEFYRPGQRYEVLVSGAGSAFDEHAANLVIVYAGHELPLDKRHEIKISSQRSGAVLKYRGDRLPIYGDSLIFDEEEKSLLVDEETGYGATYSLASNHGSIERIGYDLFHEISVLLTKGQPIENAGIPALEVHISVLRDLITASGITLYEIPAVPDGYNFIACLTHDVDHPAIRYHKFDHTMFGFLYRATLGSFFNTFRKRTSLRELVTNWSAALKLPFIHAGLARDLWGGFGDYMQLESGLRSTFFIIPFKGRPGRTSSGPAPAHRASGYGAKDIATSLRELDSASCEIALHGIDAWFDSSIGRNEFDEIRTITPRRDIGVRMHWLYFDENSPIVLENAGADYDSTVGYNQTVGYRAGTSQAYRPLGTTRILELPLHIMDTAMFFPGYLDLSPIEARKRIREIIMNAVRFGGVITANWHDRSLAPERLWGGAYKNLIKELKENGAWFATAGEAVAWFRKRRAVSFGIRDSEINTPCTANSSSDGLPGLRLRVHKCNQAARDTVIDNVFHSTLANVVN